MLLRIPCSAASVLFGLGVALASVSCSALLDTDALQEGLPDSSLPDGALAEAGQDGLLPEQGLDAPLPDQLVDDQAIPDQLVDDQAMPDQLVDDQTIPDQLVDDQAIPDQLVDDQGLPDQLTLDLLADQTAGDMLADLPAPDVSHQDSAPDGLADGNLDGTLTAAIVACNLRDALGGPTIEATDMIEASAAIEPPSAGIQLRWTLTLVEPGHPQEGELVTATSSTDQAGQANPTYYNLDLLFPPISPGSGRLVSRWEFVQAQDGSGSCQNAGDITAP